MRLTFAEYLQMKHQLSSSFLRMLLLLNLVIFNIFPNNKLFEVLDSFVVFVLSLLFRLEEASAYLEINEAFLQYNVHRIILLVQIQREAQR